MRRFADMARELRAAGFAEVRCRGSHLRFEHPSYGRITVCRGHGNRDLTPGPMAVVRKHIDRARQGLRADDRIGWHARPSA